MRSCQMLFTLTLACAPALSAQTSQADSLRARHAVLTAGVGNSYAGIGGSIETFFLRGRLSAFGAIGYVPHVSASDGRMATAGGLRAYTAGLRHRLYLEGAVAPLIADETLASAMIPFGPALALGYTYASASGFTVTLSRGIGWAPSRQRIVPVGNFALGYTWRH